MALEAPNVLQLAADKPAEVISVLRGQPSLAYSQDEHLYSLMHAAASYNHLDLLRALVSEFHVNVDLKDEDGETALFVVETLDCAKVLVEELNADMKIRSRVDGKSAKERITEEGDFPEVAVYLTMKDLEAQGSSANATSTTLANNVYAPPPLPKGVSVDIGTMAPEDAGEVADPAFRRRIEELAAREDFQGEDGQRALRELITEALRGEINQERDVRQRTS